MGQGHCYHMAMDASFPATPARLTIRLGQRLKCVVSLHVHHARWINKRIMTPHTITASPP